MQSSRLTHRALDVQRARIAAEAGLDYGVDQLLRAMRTYQFTPCPRTSCKTT